MANPLKKFIAKAKDKTSSGVANVFLGRFSNLRKGARADSLRKDFKAGKGYGSRKQTDYMEAAASGDKSAQDAVRQIGVRKAARGMMMNGTKGVVDKLMERRKKKML